MKKWLFVFISLFVLLAIAGGFWLMKKEEATSPPTPPTPEQPVVDKTLPTTPFISHTYKNIPSNLVTFNPASGLPLTSLAQTPNNLLDEAFLTA